jgi:SAM-dependent methyltransferase
MKRRRGYRAIADYYDAEHADEPMLQRDVPFMLRHFPRRRCDALEIAVGTARAAIPVAQAGYRVVGIDYDPAMLAIARRKRDFVGLDDARLRLLEMDATELKLPRRFDRVFLLFNTLLGFTTLEELDAVLGGVREHLKPSGRFWLDIFNPDPRILSHRTRTTFSTSLFYVPSLGRTVQRRVSVSVDATAQLQTVEFAYTWFDDAGVRRRARRVFELTFLFPRELQILLERNGLEIEQQWGDHDGSPLSDSSPRIIASCRLAGSKRRGARA